MKKQTPTLRDIARETGVHVSTVSRALNPVTGTSITDDVVKRIKEAADRLGYRPNRLAVGLRTNRTMTVGLMIPDITNTIFPPILRGVESVLEPLGYAVIIVNTDSMAAREHQLVDVLRERGVDGIIHAAVLRDDPKIIEVVRGGTPVVTVNRRIEGEGIPSVVNDDALGVRLVLGHLYDEGHRRIAHVAGPANLSTGQFRRKAFKSAATEMGLKLPAKAIQQAKRFDEAEGRRCTEALLDSWNPTAILCANDRLALGALEVLEERGIECPGEISVTGFNDMPFLDRIRPGLTTVRIEQFGVGQESARLLVRMMTEPETTAPSETILPVRLIKRGSVAPPPAE
ncbi:LacI family DNA-binding transcriptional regulator [Flavimaricola marinus]|uniref:Catabolite control protein A n=1 Tax=Flavimaricola marinus TaxID=1819565 RepID=A0A238LDE1_9RHOB|nr:LacI family DNA-binding transcriptional regulator [Flavimaricola marinus]SMY07689.1 Catabolite control protein A [Flavimaricola marinus]